MTASCPPVRASSGALAGRRRQGAAHARALWTVVHRRCRCRLPGWVLHVPSLATQPRPAHTQESTGLRHPIPYGPRAHTIVIYSICVTRTFRRANAVSEQIRLLGLRGPRPQGDRTRKAPQELGGRTGLVRRRPASRTALTSLPALCARALCPGEAQVVRGSLLVGCVAQRAAWCLARPALPRPPGGYRPQRAPPAIQWRRGFH